MPENRQNKPGRVYHRSAKPRKSAARAFGESADWSDHEGCEALYTNRPLHLLRCLRPGQWAKNLILLAAPFFAFFDRGQMVDVGGVKAPFEALVRQHPLCVAEMLGLGIVAFILISAAGYVVNDLADRRADAAHPLKKERPIAARQVSVGAASVLLVLCLFGGLALAGWMGLLTGRWGFPAFVLAYAALQPLYTFLARRLEGVGPMVVAAGFVLRAAAGAALAAVRLSPWLLLCVFLVALFVALCKRRSAHFLKNLPPPTAADSRILDLEIGLVASATIACYALYTLATETIANFGTDRLVYTVPLVMLGIFRHLRLTYGERKGGAPEHVFTRDPGMLAILALWVIACGALLTFR